MAVECQEKDTSARAGFVGGRNMSAAEVNVR